MIDAEWIINEPGMFQDEEVKNAIRRIAHSVNIELKRVEALCATRHSLEEFVKGSTKEMPELEISVTKTKAEKAAEANRKALPEFWHDESPADVHDMAFKAGAAWQEKQMREGEPHGWIGILSNYGLLRYSFSRSKAGCEEAIREAGDQVAGEGDNKLGAKVIPVKLIELTPEGEG